MRTVAIIAAALVACLLVGQAQAYNLSNRDVALVVLSAADGALIDSRFTGMPGPRMEKSNPSLVGGEINVHSDKRAIATIMGRDNATGFATVTFYATSHGKPIGPVTLEINLVEGESSALIHEVANGLVVRLFRYQPKP